MPPEDPTSVVHGLGLVMGDGGTLPFAGFCVGWPSLAALTVSRSVDVTQLCYQKLEVKLQPVATVTSLLLSVPMLSSSVPVSCPSNTHPCEKWGHLAAPLRIFLPSNAGLSLLRLKNENN